MALNLNASKLDVKLVQFAIPLSRQKHGYKCQHQRVRLAYPCELREEVGNDGFWFFTLPLRPNNMDFDLDLAKIRNKDNPV